ncbi:MAG: hypothetical protein ABFD79_03225 [Phycisphaerales bacterium]
MSKAQLERIENKILRLKKELEKTHAVLSELENKKHSYESELGQLEKKANLMRLEDFGHQLQAVGVDLKAVDIVQAVHVLEEQFCSKESKPQPPQNISVQENVNEDIFNAKNELDSSDDPFGPPLAQS